MKKIITLLAVSTFLFPTLALAATDVSLTSSNQQVKAGDEFTVTVALNPAANQNVYTAKIALSYNATLVSVTGFSFAPTWLPLSQPGYDLVDNTNGSLIKTAGYPGGLSSQKTFGTITFKALKSGTVRITTAATTQIYDGTNQNVFSGTSNVLAVTVAAAPVVVPKATTQTILSASIPTDNTTVAATTSVDTTATVDTTTGTDNSQVAAAAAASGTSSHTLLYSIIAAVVVLIGGGWYWFSRRA